MKLFPDKSICVLISVVLFVSGAFSLCCGADEDSVSAIPANTTVGGLRLPLGYHPNGKMRAQLTAEQATAAEGGPIQAKNVKCEFYTVEGDLDMTLTAEQCTYDKDKKVMRSNSKVQLVGKDITMTGVGCEWTASEQVVKILKDAKVVMKKAMKLVKLKGANK